MIAPCGAQKLCIPECAKAMLMLMRVFGRLAPASSEADRRLRRPVPTEKLLDLHVERNQRILRVTEIVPPEAACCRGSMRRTTSSRRIS